MSWINKDIDISDIPYDIVLQNTIKEAEELDAAQDVEFFCVCEGIDMIAKQMKASGKITQEQWDRICSKYPSV